MFLLILACWWNNKLYYDGDHWIENGVDFYYTSSDERARPGCYVDNDLVLCTGAIPGIRELSLISNDDLFLCESGDEIRPLGDRCNTRPNCRDQSDERNCDQYFCDPEVSQGFLWTRTPLEGDIMKQCSLINSNWTGTFGSKCTGNVSGTVWIHKNTCDCEKKMLVEYFKKKIADLNESNFMNVSKEMASSVEAQDFTNPKAFLDMFKDLFDAATTLLTPLTHRNADIALQYCEHVVETVLSGDVFVRRPPFCEHKLGDDLNSLADKALEFSRKAPKNTCRDQSDERNCDQYFCAPEISQGFLWTRTPVEGDIMKQCSLINSDWTGTFGSKCTGNVNGTVWIHKNTCDCEKKTLVEYFKKKIADLNESNFMKVSKEMASSVEAQDFTNPKAFLDMFKDLFDAVTTLLTPLTHRNADIALQYCEHVIETVLCDVFVRRPPYCEAKLEDDRNSLADKALEFLRQAPKNTEAYNASSSSTFHLDCDRMEERQSEEVSITSFEVMQLSAEPRTILRLKLFAKVNTAPRIPPEVIKPNPKVTDENNEVTIGNETSLNKNITTNKNLNKDITNQQIQDALRANNCTSVEFDEGTEDFVYNQHRSKESITHEKIQSNLELVLLCVSTSAVILALILLTALRLKSSERLFIHKNLLLSMGLGNLIFVLDKSLFASRRDHVALCSAVAVCQFFFHTALFTWMLVEGINLYIKLVKVFSVKRQYVAYLAIGWGIPAVLVGLIAAIRPSTFDMGKAQYEDVTCGSLNLTTEIQRARCWINGSLWIYKGPILVILVANMMLFTILLRVIFGKIAAKYSNDHLQITKRGLRSIVALLPLLGVTYVVGFFIEFHFVLAYVFLLLNSTQGVVFFIFHCVLDDQVHDAIRKLIVKFRADSKTRATPATNPNATPAMERNTRVNILQSGDRKKTTDV